MLFRSEDRVDAVLTEVFDASAAPTARAVADTLPLVDVPAGSATDDLPASVDTAPESEGRVPVFNLDELRRLAVKQALEHTKGHRGQAAALLGVSLNTMTRLVAESCPDVPTKSGRKRSPPPPLPR